MSEIVRLELPDTLFRQAKELAVNTGRSLEDVLTQWLKQGAVHDIAPLDPDVEYPIYTIFGMEEASQKMWEYLQTQKPR
jgi:hypothetical protein